jgi:hypothetical protein
LWPSFLLTVFSCGGAAPGSRFAGKPTSGRVLQKVGMKHEATFRQHLKKGDRFEDLEWYGILRDEWKVG